MRTRTLVLIGLGICLGFLLLLTGVLQPLASGVRGVTKPLIVVAARWHQSLRVSLGRSRRSEEELSALEHRIAQAVIERVRFQALEEENKALKAQLRFLSESGYESVGARVISRDLQHGHRRFLLDRGTLDAVQQGQAVLTGEGMFVGKIVSVRERVSLLEVFTDPEARTIVAKARDQKLIGVIEGRGNGAALLTYIPPTDDLRRDDILVTAGLEEKIPAQLPVALVNAVNGRPTDPFLSAAVEPLVGLDGLALVSILIPKR